jgi:hypothetical protein
VKVEPTMTLEEIAAWVPGVTGFVAPREAQHGTISGYQYHGCRCDECRTAMRAAKRKWVASVKGTEPREHGTLTGYVNHYCRCDLCRAEGARYRARNR